MKVVDRHKKYCHDNNKMHLKGLNCKTESMTHLN